MEEKKPRISFDDSIDPIEPKVSKTVKIDPSKSRFSQKVNKKVEFEQQVQEIHERTIDYQVEAIQLGKEFFKFFEKKTLTQNKGPLEKTMETELIGKLINYAIAVNNDPLQSQDGMGSVALITLLLNTTMKLRAQLNDVEYKLSLLENKKNG